MFGYLAPLKSELKIREFEIYNAYYCAICRAVKKRYGELPRLMLSYDAVLVALLAEGVAGEPGETGFNTFRCFNNPFKKRNEAARTAAIDYAADVMALLGWMSLKDRKEDRDQGSPLKGFAVSMSENVTRGTGRRAAERLGGKARVCMACFDDQRALELAKESSLDRAADPTGRMMAELLDFTDIPGICVATVASALSKKLRKIGYHLGRYIYIIDAIDDLESDRESGAYNPLLLRPEALEALKTAVSLDLAQVCEVMDNLRADNLYQDNHNNIIDNILYLGLRAKLDEVLNGKEANDG